MGLFGELLIVIRKRLTVCRAVLVLGDLVFGLLVRVGCFLVRRIVGGKNERESKDNEEEDADANDDRPADAEDLAVVAVEHRGGCNLLIAHLAFQGSVLAAILVAATAVEHIGVATLLMEFLQDEIFQVLELTYQQGSPLSDYLREMVTISLSENRSSAVETRRSRR